MPPTLQQVLSEAVNAGSRRAEAQAVPPAGQASAQCCAGATLSRSAPGGVAARGLPVGVLRSAANRRVEFRLPVWLRGVFIIAVHHAFVLGLGAARHGDIV